MSVTICESRKSQEFADLLTSEIQFLRGAKLPQLNTTASKVLKFLQHHEDYLCRLSSDAFSRNQALPVLDALTQVIDEMKLRQKISFTKEVVMLSLKRDGNIAAAANSKGAETLFKKELAIEFIQFKQTTTLFPMVEIQAEAVHILVTVDEEYTEWENAYFKKTDPIERMLEFAKEWQKALESKTFERIKCVIL